MIPQTFQIIRIRKCFQQLDYDISIAKNNLIPQGIPIPDPESSTKGWRLLTSAKTAVKINLSKTVYTVMQSDRNSSKIDTFQEADTSEVMD